MVLLTNENYIKSNLDISDNISPKFLQSAMVDAQTIYLRSVLGDALTDKLESLVGNGDIKNQDNVMYKTLLDAYVQRVIMWEVRKEIAHTTTYKIGNFGVVKSNDENLAVATKDEVVSDREFSIAKRDAYTYRMQNWLLDNKTAFPELTENNCNMIKSNLHSASSCGIWLGGVRGKMKRRCCKK